MLLWTLILHSKPERIYETITCSEIERGENNEQKIERNCGNFKYSSGLRCWLPDNPKISLNAESVMALYKTNQRVWQYQSFVHFFNFYHYWITIVQVVYFNMRTHFQEWVNVKNSTLCDGIQEKGKIKDTKEFSVPIKEWWRRVLREIQERLNEWRFLLFVWFVTCCCSVILSSVCNLLWYFQFYRWQTHCKIYKTELFFFPHWSNLRISVRKKKIIIVERWKCRSFQNENIRILKRERIQRSWRTRHALRTSSEAP